MVVSWLLSEQLMCLQLSIALISLAKEYLIARLNAVGRCHGLVELTADSFPLHGAGHVQAQT
jgi:hypothetical protein